MRPFSSESGLDPSACRVENDCRGASVEVGPEDGLARAFILFTLLGRSCDYP